MLKALFFSPWVLAKKNTKSKPEHRGKLDPCEFRKKLINPFQ